MKNVIVRSLSGIVYIALIVAAVIAGGWWMAALMAVFAAVGTYEYQNLAGRRSGRPLTPTERALDMAAAIYLVAGAALSDGNLQMLGFTLLLILLWLLIRMSFSLAVREGDAFGNVAQSVFGVLYTAIPPAILAFAGMYAGVLHTSIYVPVVLSMFILIWLNDTGAFCFGVLFGKHRLCQRLSPKKSWEGFWGGVTCAVIAGAFLSGWMKMENPLEGALFGLIVSIFSTWGDLFESMLKRSAGVKDSGKIIPGHGGLLDRIDSLLFVAPATLICYIFLMIF